MTKKIGKLFSDLIKVCLLLSVMILIAMPSSTSACNRKAKAKVMTRNLYLGADIFKVVEAAQTDPNSIPYAVAEVFQTAMYTNFPERAEAIADEIEMFEPDVVGLQEVSTYYIQTPGDFLAGNPVQANTVVIDFYTVLNAALQARGMNYTAYTVTNADIEMPMIDTGSPTYLSDVRLVDHDVILVRARYDATNVMSGNYQWQLEMDLGGTSVAFTRGYIALDVNIKGDDFRFVNTHLEVRSAPGSVFRVFQAAQMQELLTILSSETKPIIMVGDFNSSPEDIPGESYVPDGQGGYVLMPYVPPYMMTVGAGYLDTWTEQRRYDEGYTSGFDEYVSDPTAELTSRIDIIFTDPKDMEINKVKAEVVGNEVEDMTPSGFWPSDHAGVVAKIKYDK
ncbi:MAG: endonuclease/exonuclease/phosphatase family protein [bacterium]